MEIELRPLSAGEVLDRTFQLFRARFGMFVGIAVLAAGIQTAWAAVQTILMRHLVGHTRVPAAAGIWSSASSLVSILIALLAFALVFAAIARAVVALHLGQPTGITRSYQDVWRHWLRYVCLSVVAGFLSMWPLLIVIGMFGAEIALAPHYTSLGSARIATMAFGFTFLEMLVATPLCIWLLCRYALSNAACVVEDLKVRASIRRSVSLSKGSRGRIFLLLLVVYVISLILTLVVQMPMLTAVFRASMHHQTQIPLWATLYGLTAGFIVNSFITPIYGVGLAVIYLDARIRKEGYDIELLMQRSAAEGHPAPPAADTAQFASE